MFVTTVPNRGSPPAVLLRESYREDGKVKSRTLANLSGWDPQLVEHFRVLLKGGVAVESAAGLLTIVRSLPARTTSLPTRSPTSAEIASTMVVLPAPVSPVKTLNRRLSRRCKLSMIAKSLMVNSSNIVFCG